MVLEYIDLLSGDSIFITGVGHIHSPKLKELKPSGIGSFQYSLYLNLFAWDKEQFLKYTQIIKLRGLKAFNGKDFLNVFDVITLIPQTRELLYEAISFFMDEQIQWNDSRRCFDVITTNGDIIGKIDRNNFEEFSKAILQINYIRLDKNKLPSKAPSKQAQERWDKVQGYLNKQASQYKKKENSEYSLGNMISKLCVLHNSYNLLNIYELTVFQFYDQFFQLSFLRGIDINDRIFAIHGGDKYKANEWMKPITIN